LRQRIDDHNRDRQYDCEKIGPWTKAIAEGTVRSKGEGNVQPEKPATGGVEPKQPAETGVKEPAKENVQPRKPVEGGAQPKEPAERGAQLLRCQFLPAQPHQDDRRRLSASEANSREAKSMAHSDHPRCPQRPTQFDNG